MSYIYFELLIANRTLYKATIKLMRHVVKYGGNETLMLLNTDTKEWVITSQQDENSVKFTPSIPPVLTGGILFAPRADRRRRSCAGNRSVSEDAEHRTALSA